MRKDEKTDFRITFLNPPYISKFSRPQRSPAVTKSGTLYYPMWLAYAAAAAEKAGFSIDLIDAPADGLDMSSVTQKIKDFRPSLIVVDTSTPSIYNDAEVCNALKTALPDAFIVIVGTHVTALPEDSLKLNPSIDAAAVGEYDYTIAALAEALYIKTPLDAVAGLYFKDGTNTGLRPPIGSIDELPFVSRIYKRFLKMENYFNPNALFPMVTITTSRGCPHECIFCVYPQTLMGHKLRMRSVENVLDEIEYIISAFDGVKAIFFEDDTFTANRKRCVEISEGIIKRGIKISWTANARATLDYETMRVMKRAGCRSFCVGFESGSQEMLDNIKKKTVVENMGKFMEDARKAGILVHGCFMVGLPGETKQTMDMTLALAKRLNPDTVQFYPMMIYPGTEAYDWYSERGLLTTKDFSKWLTPWGLHNTVIKTEQLSSEALVRFCDNARREFYLRPAYLLYKLRQVIAHPEELKRTVKSARTFMKYLLRGSDLKKGEHCD
ncbi:B12-binding domain-containing radical SAM protein [Candidatus Magnetominusculus xianensis]|uniref:B12-binding domain-containing radical SAM protein n=1 Tax=Candidatus Magnetominusculus xianensis TaxID=1748249 RepID=A0ABR5SC07_9BACT|nr:radical SAM protein [Candidatus Magnetominusculus xianensis]KWT78416.1 B12-binding domain-containing radical SAM protein [Candidatus Magnetominusculus xianensis]MBF0403157.1 radical SAM protein [Nitrospirota bacterium]